MGKWPMTLEQSHGLMESNKEVLIFMWVLGSQGRSFSAGEFVSFCLRYYNEVYDRKVLLQKYIFCDIAQNLLYFYLSDSI